MEENNKGKVKCPYCEEETKKFVKGRSHRCIYCYDTGLIDWIDAIIRPIWGHSGTSSTSGTSYTSGGEISTSGSYGPKIFVGKSGIIGCNGVTIIKGNIK